MMNFKEIELNYGNEDRIKEDKNEGKRYVISVDPFNVDSNESITTIVIFDKHTSKISSTIRTKKTFDQWVAKFSDKTVGFNKEYLVSRKFLNKDGSVKTREQIVG